MSVALGRTAAIRAPAAGDPAAVHFAISDGLASAFDVLDARGNSTRRNLPVSLSHVRNVAIRL